MIRLGIRPFPASRHVCTNHWNKARKYEPVRSLRVKCCVGCSFMRQPAKCTHLHEPCQIAGRGRLRATGHFHVFPGIHSALETVAPTSEHPGKDLCRTAIERVAMNVPESRLCKHVGNIFSGLPFGYVHVFSPGTLERVVVFLNLASDRRGQAQQRRMPEAKRCDRGQDAWPGR